MSRGRRRAPCHHAIGGAAAVRPPSRLTDRGVCPERCQPRPDLNRPRLPHVLSFFASWRCDPGYPGQEETIVGEYSISICVDRNGLARLGRDAAVFVRRIDPPLATVYTIICDSRGRARPSFADRRSERLVRTGPVDLSTEFAYLAAWIPGSELSRQGNIVSALLPMDRDTRYTFEPSEQDERAHRVQAARWQGGAPALSASDLALVSVLQDIGLSSLAPQALIAPQSTRRALAGQIIEELEEVKQRELGGRFIIGTSDAAGQLRDRLLTNPEYRSANRHRRAQMIAEWQRRL